MRKMMKSRKAVAWMMMLVFLFTCVMPTGTVFAGVNETAQQIVLNPTQQEIVGTGAGSDGNVDVKIQKSIAATDKENEFEITLTVSTPENLETIPSSADAAVVLVVDTSGSMQEYTGKVTRMQAARDAAKAFLKAFASSRGNASDERKVAIVEFWDDAETVTTFTELNAAGTNLDKIIDRELRTGDDRGTNMEGGLQLALNLVENAAARGGALENISNVTIILLTDGCPTFHISSEREKDDTDSIDGTRGGGNQAKVVDWKPVINVANTIKTTKVNDSLISLKTVALATGTDKFEIDNDKYGEQWQDVVLVDWLQNNVSTTYAARDAASLVDSFEQINTLITLGTQAWQVTDPMAANIVYTGSDSGNATATSGNTYVFVDNTLTWNLKNSVPTTNKVGTTTWYTYSLTYPIRLDNTNADVTGAEGVVTNGTTVLDYFMFSKVDGNDTVAISDMKHANFNVPKVKGYEEDTFEFTKVDAGTGKALAGAKFTLTLNECHAPQAGAYSAEATSDADGKVKFENIPSGHTYTLTEVAPIGYAAMDPMTVKVEYGVLKDVSGNLITTIENTPNTISISGSKTWNDNDNAEGLRPESITVKVMNGEEVVDSKVVTAEDNWAYEFTGLQKYENGQEIVYTIAEDAVEGYTTVIEGTNIINSRDVATTSISGTKTWNDNDNQDGKRPESITVNVMNGEEVVESKVVTAEDNWAYEFTGLQKYENGKEIVYTISENAVANYDTEINGYDITNTYSPEVTNVTVTKVWKDGNSQLRPGYITVNLLANGVVVDTANVDGDRYDNSWTYTFEDLPRYDNGEAIVYTVTEEAVENYVTVVNGYTITNTISDQFDISGTKTWIDNDDEAWIGEEEKTRPAEVLVDLYRNGQLIDTAIVSAATNWAYSFENLEAYDANGNMYKYSVEEQRVENYVPSYEVDLSNKDNRIVNITNTLVETDEAEVYIWGQKHWIAPEDKIPTSITVELYRNNAMIDSVVVTADEYGYWSFGFEPLPKYDENGAAYNYEVREVAVAGFTTTYAENHDGGVDITNIYTENEGGAFSVSKVVSGDLQPAADTEYGFRLKIKATVAEWTSLLVYQRDELHDANETAKEMVKYSQEELDEAIDTFKANASVATTGSAYEYEYQFLMVGDRVETSSGSAYELTGLLENGAILTTTGSAIDIGKAQNAEDMNLLDQIVEVIRTIAHRISNFHADVVLDLLGGEVENTTPSALMFRENDVESLIYAERNLQEAKEYAAETQKAYDDFLNQEVTTSTAIKVTLTPTNGGEAVVYELDEEDLMRLDGEEDEAYVINFTMMKDNGYVVAIDAAAGAVVKYSLSEISWVADDYEGTEIRVNGAEAIEGRVVTERTASVNGDSYVFHNMYGEDTYNPPYNPPYTPPPGDDDVPPPPEPPTPPVIIDEEPVPQNEPPVEIPGEIIEEEDIPLGDAPPTGDNTNAAPFMMMMAIAAAGLTVVRRRFN